MDIDMIRNQIKNKSIKKSTSIKMPNYFIKSLNKVLVVIVITLMMLIALKSNTNFKTLFYKEVYDTHFSFATVNHLYQTYFGSSLPFKDFFENSKPVFSEKLSYTETSVYKDGVKLTVSKNYLVPNQLSGLVVFIGEKEGYGPTIVIQQVNGVDLWYANVNNVSVKLYDYVEQGELLGTTIDNSLYLVYKKDGVVLNYEDYL
ncbi:MAG: M23 family metallopeptidase [Bacilli bacterium]|nr:M23 family metallopeptidase [Bacilli bacterium]MDD4808996.1 M23 family metallopeptidase [Bacilli bacterium]